MKVTIKTKNGTEVFDTEDVLNRNGSLYQSLVNYFNDWINNYASQESKDMYFGSFEELGGGSYCTWKGAIQEMYQVLCEYCEEHNLKYLTTKKFYDMDFDGAIQP